MITACGLHPRKGIADLIAGFKNCAQVVPEATLYIFGSGPNEEEYKALAAEKPSANIEFCGQVPHLRSYFEAGDVFILASLADQAPLVICEAREAGLAVIGTRVDGIPELLEFGKAGLLIDPNAPEQIAHELRRLLCDNKYLQNWKDNSQVNIRRLRVDRVAEQVVQVYRECVPHQN